MADVERFWTRRGESHGIDAAGFLADPTRLYAGRVSANPNALSTADIANRRALVMLGEMGAGKSHVVGQPHTIVPAGVTILAQDLASFGSEDRVVAEILRSRPVTAWLEGDGEMALVLDSFDEAQARIPNLGQVLAAAIAGWPLERLWLRIASRSSSWSASLEAELRSLYHVLSQHTEPPTDSGDDNDVDPVEVVELLGLRRCDAAAIAAEMCDDPDGFLAEVDRAKASAFASRPQTLRLLAGAYAKIGRLPDRITDVYAEGVRALCDELNLARRDSSRSSDGLSVDERIAVLRRIAAFIQFGGSAAIWTGPDATCGNEDLRLSRLVGGSEPAANGVVQITEPAVREVLASAMFRAVGPSRLAFAHDSFKTYLAAEWILSNGLRLERTRPLLVGPTGRVWPQIRSTAAWLVASGGPLYAELARQDPESFRSEIDLPSDDLRAAVVDALFVDPASSDRDFFDRLSGLAHRGLAEQLHPHLRGGSVDHKILAIDIARDCRVGSAREDLIALVLDTAEHEGVRARAGFTLVELDRQRPTGALVPLVREPSLRADDHHHELLGIGLLASWPHEVSTQEAFSWLASSAVRNFHGALEMFHDELAESLTLDDVHPAIEWLGANLDNIGSPSEAKLANAIIRLAASQLHDDLALDVLSRLVAKRADEYEGLLFQDFSDDTGCSIPVQGRNRLVERVLAESSDSLLPMKLTTGGAFPLGLVGADDLEWVAERAVEGDDATRDGFEEMFRHVFDESRDDHLELLWSLPEDHPIRAAHPYLYAIELASDRAARMRQFHESQLRREGEIEGANDDLNQRILDLVSRVEAEPDLFWRAVRLVTIAPGASHGSEHDVDLTKADRWSTFSDDERARIVASADIYLRNGSCKPEEWLSDPSVHYRPSTGAFRAFVLLLRCDLHRLDALPKAVWVEWAPAIVAETCAINRAAWADKRELLVRADPHAHEALVQSLLARVRAHIVAGSGLFLTKEIDFLFDDLVAQEFLGLADASGSNLQELLEALVRNRPELGRQLARNILADPTADAGRLRAAATAAVNTDLWATWSDIRPYFEADHAVALAVLGQSVTIRFGERTSEFDPEVAADLYLWLRNTYAPEDDPSFDQVHAVGPRESVGHFRDRLLDQIAGSGTPEGIRAVERIISELPEATWLRRLQARALDQYSQAQWRPVEPPALLRIASEERSTVVHTERDLMAVVTAGLSQIQDELIGANPLSHLLWDTHSGRPKSEDEISDLLRNRLQELIGVRRVVVNREVQVRRNRPSGVPERTDIQTDAISADGTIKSLPIEVKGAWNDELLSAMRGQLAEQYMSDLGVRHGCYVVVWPDLASWSDTTDGRRRTFARLDFDLVSATLIDQATHLQVEGREISVVNLRIDYLRPAAE